MTVMSVLGLLCRSPSDTCLRDEDAGGYVSLQSSKGVSVLETVLPFQRTSCLILTVVILETFSVKLLTEPLKAWKGVMHPLFYPIL